MSEETSGLPFKVAIDGILIQINELEYLGEDENGNMHIDYVIVDHPEYPIPDNVDEWIADSIESWLNHVLKEAAEKVIADNERN